MEINPLRFPKSKESDIPLHLNESYHLLPKNFVFDVASRINSNDITRYRDKSILEERMADFMGLDVKQVVAVPGSDSAIEFIYRLFLSKQNVNLLSPAFTAYEHLAKIYDTDIHNLWYEPNGDVFCIKIENILNVCHGAHTIISNPANPTGNVHTRSELLSVLSMARKNKKLVCIDEAYYGFYNQTVVDLINDYDNLVVIRTMSKSFGLAGLRVGFIIANENIANEIQKLQLPSPISSLSIKYALYAIEQRNVFMARIKEYKKLKKQTENKIKNLGLKIYNTETNFILIEIDKPINLLDFIKNKYSILGSHVSCKNAPLIFSKIARIAVPSNKHLKILENAVREFMLLHS